MKKCRLSGLHFFVYQNLLLKLEILLGVVVGDVFDHLSQEVKLAGRQQTRLHIITNKVAERSAEILVARIAQEAARVGEHTHKAAQQAQQRERIHLSLHSIHLDRGTHHAY